MKKIAAVILISLLTACGDNLEACGKTFEPTGLLTMDDCVDGVKYKVIPGNIVWGALLVSTIAAPIWFFGFSMWEPVSADCTTVRP